MWQPSGTFLRLAVLALVALSFSGCDAVGAVFKAGVWAGVLLVVVIIVLVGFLVLKIGRRT